MNEVRKLVDVVIPTVGRPSLRNAVSSVAAQLYPAHRVIVVLDDPRREEDVRSMLSGLQVDILVTSGGLGGAGARNLGSEAGASPWIAYLDDDDTWTTEHLKQFAASVPSRCSSTVLYASAYLFKKNSASQIRVPERMPPEAGNLGTYLVSRRTVVFGENAMQSSSIIVSRHLFESVKWDDRLRKHQDWDFLIRARQAASSFIWSNEPAAIVAQGSAGSLSKSTHVTSSKKFLARHGHELSKRARADFVWVHLFPPLVRGGHFRDAWEYFPIMPFGHFAAAIRGIFACLGR